MNPVYVLKAEEAKLHLSKGNSKIGKGIWSFSTLPGNSKNLLYIGEKSALLTDVPGTCSKYCEGCFNGGCYAVNSVKLHHNVNVRAWGENTLLLRSGKLFKEIHAFIEKKNSKFYKTYAVEDLAVKTFRINVSGEIESKKEFEEWNKLAIAHPEVTFALYTKNFDDLNSYIEDRIAAGATDETILAQNFIINISQWHHVADTFIAAHPGLFNIFEYDDSNRKSCEMPAEDVERLASVPHCPAVTKEGHHAKNPAGEDITCDHCLRCYRKHGGITAVYSH